MKIGFREAQFAMSAVCLASAIYFWVNGMSGVIAMILCSAANLLSALGSYRRTEPSSLRSLDASNRADDE